MRITTIFIYSIRIFIYRILLRGSVTSAKQCLIFAVISGKNACMARMSALSTVEFSSCSPVEVKLSSPLCLLLFFLLLLCQNFSFERDTTGA